MTKLVVTITPPTPNGDLHIGHLAGPFMGADVFTRVQRQRGHECVLVSYSDDYQSYMLRRGLELGRDPVELAGSNTARIRESLALAGVQVDHWMQPHGNPYFEAAVREVFEAARAAGAIEFKDSSEPYCAGCDRWGYEAFGRGDCNYCGADSDASQCEGCGYEPVAREMKNYRCKLCGRPHEWRTVNRAFLRLDMFADMLKALYRDTPMRKPLDAWAAQAAETILKDWGVTRPGDGGLDLEPDGSCRIHTWFMGLAGYMGSFREYAETVAHEPGLFEQYWASEGSRLVHFLGHDCALSHVVVYPALLSTMPRYRIRPWFYANQFLTLNGSNLSTSRNHAIWIRDLVAEACSDSARLYLAYNAPEESEGDFNLETFRAWRQEIFIDFFDALIEAAAQSKESWTVAATGDDIGLVEHLRSRWLSATSLDQFSMKKMAQIVFDVIALARLRLADGRPVRHLAVLAAVFGSALHPKLSARVFETLETDGQEASRLVVEGFAHEYAL